MSSKCFSATLVVSVLWACLNFVAGWPLIENATALVQPMKVFELSTDRSVSSVNTKSKDPKNEVTENNNKSSGSLGVNIDRLPPSPANLLKPDRFQFYTYNERGDMITKQMTMEEIQALIAGGGPDHFNADIQEPQKVEDILTGGKKVMDVVEKVQNVLKSAMVKPTTLTGSMPTVPEKANVEWSNILPALLAGDKYGNKVEESHYDQVEVEEATTKPIFAFGTAQNESVVVEFVKLSATTTVPFENTTESTLRNEAATGQVAEENQTRESLSTIGWNTGTLASTERLMIPVPVITAEQNVPISQRVTQAPVFQKITEIVSLENVQDEKHDSKEKHRDASTTTPTAAVTINDAQWSLESASKTDNYNVTSLVVSTMSDSNDGSLTNEQPARQNGSSTLEVKTEFSSTNENQIRPSFDNGAKTDSVPASESNKVQIHAVDEPFTMSSFHSLPTFTTTTKPFVTTLSRESSTTIRDVPLTTPTGHADQVELANSWSNVISQVSESASSVLPLVFGSGFESTVQPHRDDEDEHGNENHAEKNRENGSDIWTSTAPTIPIAKLPTINEEKPANADGEGIQTTTVETKTSFGLDQEHASTTTNVMEGSNSLDVATISSVTRFTLNSTKMANTTDTITSNSMISTTTSDRVHPSTVTSENLEEPVTSNPLYSSKATEHSSNTIYTDTNVNFTRPIAIIDNMLETFSTEISSTPVTETLTLPHDLPENWSPNTLASGLIAGFQTLASNTSTTLYSEKLNWTDPALKKEAFSSPQKVETLFVTAEPTEKHALVTQQDSTKSNDTDQGTVAIGEHQFINFTWPTDSHKDTSLLVETTEVTTIVTRPSTSSSEREIEESTSGDAWKNTSVKGNEASPVTGMYLEHVASIGGSAHQTSEKETTFETADTTTKSPLVKTSPTSERISHGASKTNDTTSSVHMAANLTESSWTERAEDIVETNTRQTFLFLPSHAVTRPAQKQHQQEHDMRTNASNSDAHNITDDSFSKEMFERAKNNTTAQAWSNVNPTFASNVMQFASSVIETSSKRNATKDENSDETFNRTVAIDSSTEQFDENNSTLSSANGSKSQTTRPNELTGNARLNASDFMESQLKIPYKSQQINDHFDSNQPNSNTSTDSQHTWQRISLHQIAPTPISPISPSSTSSSSSFSSPSSLFTSSSSPTTMLSSLSLSSLPVRYSPPSFISTTKQWIATTKKPITVSESTTKFQYNLSEMKTDVTSSSVVEEQTTESMVSLNASKSSDGLDISTRNASIDVVRFSRLCNELAFKFWTAANEGLSSGRSLVISPFGMTSLLAMIFLGARGSTSDQMNEVLGLDNVATFNPHLIFQNVTDTVSLARHQGIANAAFVRELFADKAKVRKLLPFYKEQAQQFYEGLVAEVNFATISDLARRRTNLMIRKQTGGRIKDFVKSNAIPLRSPLAAISANVFQTECNASSVSAVGRDGELYFAVSSAHKLRKLIPVPASVWRSNILVGYEPSMDVTAVAVGGAAKLVSTIYLVPGQQGHVAPGDTLDRLEQRLVKGAFREGAWNKILNVLIPRTGVELQIPKFTHRSIVNATAALKRMGLDQLFSSRADFKGINGIGNRLFLSDVLQMNLFSTCGDEYIANGRHHVEIYPASPSLRDLQHDEPLNVEKESVDELQGLTRKITSKNDRTISTGGTTTINVERSKDKPRLKLDQPFLYFVRHNPTGLILHMGRFNPRLL